MAVPMRSAEFRALLEPTMEVYFSGDTERIKEFERRTDLKMRQYIAEKYPDGIPEITAEERGMCSGNAR